MGNSSTPPYSDTPSRSSYDAVVIGSGPNGLAAAITLAKAGKSVLVVEAADTPGGGMRAKELTLPGYIHDVCSAVHPMAVASPFFRSVGLEAHGLEWTHAKVPLAHPLDGGEAALMHRSLEETIDGLGEDGDAYRKLVGPLVGNIGKLTSDLLGPLKFPKHPFAMAGFGLKGMLPALEVAEHRFKTEAGRALFAGNAAHSIQPLEKPFTSAIGLMLMAVGHHVGWPVPKGGSQMIAEAMVSCLEAHGGELVCGQLVESLNDLPEADHYFFDTSPTALATIAEKQLPLRYRTRLARYRYGPGIFKVDWALKDPIPWEHSGCRDACTVHVGGGLHEIAESESDCWEGRHSENPFVLVAQPSVFDDTRAPDGKHTGWAYCHVPAGSDTDMTSAIENQVERFAPGFKKTIIKRHTMNCAAMEAYNPNYVGGDIICGVQDIGQMFTRPVARLNPYSTPNKRIFICSSATPPGGGVHGMAGFHAAQSVL